MTNSLLSVFEAWDKILTTVPPGSIVHVPLQEAHGLVLAEDLHSPGDSPPFDKALMDGYAIRTADCLSPSTHLEIIEEVTAGRVARHELSAGQAIRIMTGAPLPRGADAVVPVEQTAFVPGSSNDVEIRATKMVPEMNLARQGAAIRRGDLITRVGSLVRAQEIAALAEWGFVTVAVRRRPRVAILATGDELVPASETPGPGQIRNTNEPMLVAQVRQMGAEPVPLGIARDDRNQLREKVLRGLECDFLMLSGGVSAGKLDLVPSVLQEAEVRQIFHKIQMKPGKPLWFGAFSRADQSGCFVFGLPGNPVSSMVCAELFTRAAIRRWLGLSPNIPPSLSAKLTTSYPMREARATYHPAFLKFGVQGPEVEIVDWEGSFDISATVAANSVIAFPGGTRDWQAGDSVEVIEFSK